MRSALALGWGVLVAFGLARRLRGLRFNRPPPRRDRHDRPPGAALERELPFAADLFGVALAGGLTPFLAVQLTARHGPPTVRAHLTAVLDRVEVGIRLTRALEDEAFEAPGFRPLAEALVTSERSGAPVGPLLARVAADGRARLRRRALAHARKLPVRLLFPLVFLVLPAFLLLTVAPVLIAGVG